ncbi:MAG: Rnase Y domain-containing protein, partial [Planctomycetota bacterium]|nr:Rnase Y domain-containing protein [Planctomycetota bacterium]
MFTQPLLLALDVPGPWDVVAIIIGLFFGAFAGIAIHAAVTGRSLTAARLEGERIVKSAWERAEARDRELEQASEERIRQRRDAAEQEVRQ